MEQERTLNPRKKPKPFYLGLLCIFIIVVIASVAIVQSTLDQPDDTGKTGETDKTNEGPIKVELTTDKTTCAQGEVIKFSISVENNQDEAVPQPNVIGLSVRADNGAYSRGSTEHITFGVDSVPTFEPHSKTLLKTQPWSVVETMEPGSYTATVKLTGSSIDCETTCTFIII